LEYKELKTKTWVWNQKKKEYKFPIMWSEAYVLSISLKCRWCNTRSMVIFIWVVWNILFRAYSFDHV